MSHASFSPLRPANRTAEADRFGKRGAGLATPCRQRAYAWEAEGGVFLSPDSASDWELDSALGSVPCSVP